MYAPAERSSALPPFLDESDPVFCCASGPVEKPHLLNGVISFLDRNLFLSLEDRDHGVCLKYSGNSGKIHSRVWTLWHRW
jgi:hypothetical protein